MAVEAQLGSENLGFPLISGSQDWHMSSVLGIDNDGVCLFQENQDQCFQFLGPNNSINQASSSSSRSSFLSMDFPQFLASALEKQWAEIDSYLQFQNELLRSVLREESRQRGVILQTYASRLMSFVEQKENDLAMANNRTMELQECLTRAEMESKIWQKKAIESEALVMGLSNKINEVKERICLISNGAPDAESFCDSSFPKGIAQNKKMAAAANCRLCHVRSSCVLFFPCRHLCCCKACEGVVGFCPVCDSVKEAAMEVFLG